MIPNAKIFPQRYICNTCDYRRDIVKIPRAYLLPDGRQVPMMQRHFWCWVCDDVSPFEFLARDPDADEFERKWVKELRQLQALTAEQRRELSKHDQSSAEHAEQLLAELSRHEKDWQEWKALRTEPARCLRCQLGADWLPDNDSENIPHESCDGILRCTVFLEVGLSGAYIPHIYSVDGVLLEQGKNLVRSTGSYEPMGLYCEPDWHWPRD